MRYSPSEALALIEIELEKRRRLGTVAPTKRLTFLEWLTKYFPHVKHYDHVVRLANVLQRVADGELKRVMVFEPPRHGKSLLCSELFPAYFVSCYPQKNVGLCSYGAGLANMLSRGARDNYVDAGGTLNPSARGVEHWETSQGGRVFAAGVGGVLTGKGFHLGVIDDPIKDDKEAESQLIREGHKAWWKKTFYTRCEPDAAIIIVQTRWHDDDLSGWLLQQESQKGRKPQRWHIVCMPAIKDAPLPFPATCTVEPDERKIGEALCSERYPIEELEAIKSQDETSFQSLYQQNPVTDGGNIIKAEWWDDKNRYGPEYRKVLSRMISLDTALKDEEWNDNTAWTVFEVYADYRIGTREVSQIKIESTELPDLIIDLAKEWNKDGLLRAIVIEDKNSGTTAIQTLRKSAPSWIAEIVIAFMPNGTKSYRAKQAAIWCKRNMVLMPSIALGYAWVHEVIGEPDGEFLRFPRTRSDDRTDSFSQGILYLENILAAGYAAQQATGVAA